MLNNLCWGVLIFLFGLSIIAKSIFGFSFPIFKIFLGILFIYLGLSMIFNLHYGNGRNVVRFGSAHFQDTVPARKYSIVFGKGTIDLSHIEVPENPTYMKIDTVFGDSKITINKNIPTTIILNSVFANIELPYDQMQQTSSNTYQLSNKKPLLTLEINVVFSKTKINVA